MHLGGSSDERSVLKDACDTDSRLIVVAFRTREATASYHESVAFNDAINIGRGENVGGPTIPGLARRIASCLPTKPQRKSPLGCSP